MKIRNLPVLCLTFALLCAPLRADDAPAAPPSPAPPSVVPDAAQITERWRAYFQALQSLRLWTYDAQMQLWEKSTTPAGAAPRIVSDIKIRYAHATAWFYREMQVREADKAPYQMLAVAFDGKKHQMAVKNPKPEMIDGHPARKMMLVATTPFSADPTTRSSFHLPLAMPFIFASKDTSVVPFSTLQKSEFWADVQKRITKVTPDIWQGHAGFTVSIAALPGTGGKARGERIEAFVDDTSGLPLRVQNINDQTQQVVGELKITQLRVGENGEPALPLRIEISGDGSKDKTGEVVGTGLITVEPASVSMNAPLDSARFTIPFASMDFVIENGKVLYSRFAKTAAKISVKVSSKSPAKPKKRTKRKP